MMPNMPSPFPGMDPFLERYWSGVHASLAARASDVLNDRLPPDLVASVGEREAVERETHEQPIGPGAADALLSAPVRLVLRDEPITERYVEIIDLASETSITRIEFVNPSNKGVSVATYRTARAELLASGVSVVEVDLCRAGDWRALMKPHHDGGRCAALYRVTIRVPKDPAAVYLFPIRLQDRLPEIEIPLRAKDPQLKLELQPLLDQAYVNGRYHRRIDYRLPLAPPLGGEDAAFAATLIQAK